ncbi:Z1 domain-containing protein [Deinococcus sp. Marseille-Q6407]|uniref:Z1 domain-containing protein n=1 Tax=Deinococcus sp. Marseille-Q6407 TaxID=2969223 RepID=UPI0021BDFCF7|nr:Z1 domain-containing protein [Deinococcus sp. Marseille-Q6407]
MTTINNHHEGILELTRTLLNIAGQEITYDLIAETVTQASQTLKLTLMPEEVQQINSQLRELYAVSIGQGAILIDNRDHEPWLQARSASITWNLYRRYEKYLASQGWHPRTLSRLSELSASILGLLEDPRREGSWDRRGMVVGQVQSGKTANYTALINRALDAGYPLIIVLAGRFNDLRSQTQQRIDEGVLGYDTLTLNPAQNAPHRIGVGQVYGYGTRHINSPTTSAQNGDFSSSAGGIKPGKDPVVMVVKKQKTVLKRLLKWCENLKSTPMPVLIIDDEADDSSVNTRTILDENGNLDPEYDPTVINGLIRLILNAFDRRCYLGYTATPYANIFITREGRSTKYGDDLFPRSFIVSLPAPDNYIGPERIFGMSDDPILGTGREGLDLARPVTDWADWVPAKHDTAWIPSPDLPPSLHTAIRCFILATAARRARGQGLKHSSMLVHVTRLKAVQKRVTDQINDEMSSLRNRIRYGLKDETIRDELHELWDAEFTPLDDGLTWEQVNDCLTEATEEIVVKTINGDAKDSLQYHEHCEVGLKVIVIGGDRLSRGLTLEGLVTSYYLRNAGAYDTLLQMGRWFGYRPGYLDLCRLFTSPSLIEQYVHVTLASEELRRQLELMSELEMTPEQFGLRVRTDPNQTMTVTSMNKMRSGTPLQLSYSATLSEQVTFLTAPAVNINNQNQVKKLLTSAGQPAASADQQGKLPNIIWHHVDPDLIVDFLRGYRISSANFRMIPTALAQYIEGRNTKGALIDWTVVLVSNSRAGDNTTTLAGQTVGYIQRTHLPPTRQERLAIRRLLSPPDEALDLTPGERKACIQEVQGRNGPVVKFSPVAARRKRGPQRGLLLIYPLQLRAPGGQSGDNPQTAEPTSSPALQTFGIAVSFPSDPEAREMKYLVNETYWQNEHGLPDSEEDAL